MFNEEALELAIIESFVGLGYEHIYGPDIIRDYHECILKDIFFNSMYKINKDITEDIVDEVYRKIRNLGNAQLVSSNYEFSKMLYRGVEVPLQGDKTYLCKLIDREDTNNNIFNIVNQYTVEDYKTKRPDLITFINGIPLVVFELKSAIKENTTIENAFMQIKNYQMDIKSLFNYNVFSVITDGVNAKIGTITAGLNRYMTWKSVNGERPEENINQVEVLLNGVFVKSRFIDIITNFIVFQNSEDKTVKIVSGYHQYFAVKKAIESTKKALVSESRKAGIVWHTQGSGKSLDMVFYTGLLMKDISLNNPTVVVLTDRNDLDNQLFSTFSICNSEILPQTPKHANNRDELKNLLSVNAGGIIFTTIQKFDEGTDILTSRSNVIFIADEAHRSQYGLTAKFNANTGDFKYGYAKNVRDAMPNATFIGFTGTPIDFIDRSTRELFGDYIDIYDMTQAVEDNATIPIYYENRIAKLNLNEDLLEKADDMYNTLSNNNEAKDEVIEQSKRELAKLESIIGSKQRLSLLATDIVSHYEQRENILEGKAMIVCMSRKVAINLYKEILNIRCEWKNKIKVVLTDSNNDPEDWHDIVGNKQYRDEVAIEFKDINSELKIVIVVDMWLTGFDVPSLSTMYIDKPMVGHNLMQAIARVNRVYKDKEAGLIVDYIGIGTDLKQALSKYTNRDIDKVPDISKAYQILMEKLEIMKNSFYGFNYTDFFSDSNEVRLKTLSGGINYVLGFDEQTKKDFIREATALSQADTLCRTMLDYNTKIEVEYFKSVKVGICKVTGNGEISTSEVNEKISIIIEDAIKQDGAIDIFKIADMENTEISILSEKYLNIIKNMSQKNIAVELLKRLLEGNIKVFKKTNIVKSELFSEKLKKAMQSYNNRLIGNTEVIKILFDLSNEIISAHNEGKDKGLSVEEYAFYNALVKDPKILLEMKDNILIKLAHELTQTVQKSRTVDWDKKQSARAYMRKVVKRLLRQYNYPPKEADGAVDIVIKQAELMSSNI
ncbi:MAG: type I restriction endonuclease subunit R [Clostridia bacterium]